MNEPDEDDDLDLDDEEAFGDDDDALGEARDEGAGPKSSPWDAIARECLARWEKDGAIELEPKANLARLIDALADVLAGDPDVETLEDFLLDRPEIAEVFADGATLDRTVRAIVPRR